MLTDSSVPDSVCVSESVNGVPILLLIVEALATPVDPLLSQPSLPPDRTDPFLEACDDTTSMTTCRTEASKREGPVGEENG